MSSQNRRHNANVKQRHSDEIRQLRVTVRAMLSNTRTDKLGRDLSAYVAGCR